MSAESPFWMLLWPAGHGALPVGDPEDPVVGDGSDEVVHPAHEPLGGPGDGAWEALTEVGVVLHRLVPCPVPHVPGRRWKVGQGCQLPFV